MLQGIESMDDSIERRAELRRMKFLATALLGVAALVFIGTSFLEEEYIWVGFVRATAEAAMVGAIADWFAVTAVFQHPLGLKIPHTAIIPKRKDNIAQTFGRFVKEQLPVQGGNLCPARVDGNVSEIWPTG